MLTTYLIIAVLLAVAELVYFKIADKCNIIDKPNERSSHKRIVLRGGGIIFTIALWIWSIWSGFQYPWLLAGVTLAAGVSFWDDVKSLPDSLRLVVQFAAMFMVFQEMGLLHWDMWWIVPIALIVCVGATNIYNFMDGINGMTGGYSLVVSLALLYVNEYQVHFAPRSLLIYVILAVIIFNVFNFRRQAKCFAGDVGSLSIGFIVVYFVLILALRGHSMSWMAMLIVYGVDGGLTILHRILLRENIMKPHKKHAYQIMANELKMPHLVVSGIYMGMQAICCAWFIAYPGYLTLFLQVGTLSVMYLLFMKRYYHLHVKH